MNKKIVGVLTALLIVTLALPVLAKSHGGHMDDKMDVEFGGEIKTVFDVGSYGDNEQAAAELWADDDVLDENYNNDPDLFPAEKAFYQNVDFDIAGTVNDNISFDVVIDTLTKNYTATEGFSTGTEGDANTLGNPGANSALTVDTTLLKVSDGVSTLKIGDLGGFMADTYFIDDEGLEGMELTTSMNNADMRAFMLGQDNTATTFANNQTDFYGLTYTQNLANGFVAGKLYSERSQGNANSTNYAVEGSLDLNEATTLGAEFVANDSDNANNDGDTLMRADAEYMVSDAISVNGKIEMVGEDFAPGQYHDLELARDYDLYTVGGEMELDANNSVNAAYTMVANNANGNPDDKSTIEVGLNNVTGSYNNHASIALTANDNYNGDDTTVIKLGTEYAMDAATLSAELTNQSSDYDNEFNYLAVNYDQTVTENVMWNTEFGYLDGTASSTTTTVGSDTDAESTHLETAVTIKF